MPSRAGSASSSPASGYRAPGANTARRPRPAGPTGPAPAPRPGEPGPAAPEPLRPGAAHRPPHQAGAARGGPGRRALPAGRHPAQRVAHAERRHPGRRGDLAQGRSRRVQFSDPRCQLRGQLRGPLRARREGTSPASRSRPAPDPPPHRSGSTPNAARPAPGSPPAAGPAAPRRAAARLIPRIQANVASPCTDTSLPRPRRRPADRARFGSPGGQQRQGQLGGIPAIIHPIPAGPVTALISGTGLPRPRTRRKHRKNGQ